MNGYCSEKGRIWHCWLINFSILKMCDFFSMVIHFWSYSDWWFWLLYSYPLILIINYTISLLLFLNFTLPENISVQRVILIPIALQTLNFILFVLADTFRKIRFDFNTMFQLPINIHTLLIYPLVDNPCLTHYSFVTIKIIQHCSTVKWLHRLCCHVWTVTIKQVFICL